MININNLLENLAYEEKPDNRIQTTCPKCSGDRFYINTKTVTFICFHSKCKIRGGERRLYKLFKNELGENDEELEDGYRLPNSKLLRKGIKYLDKSKIHKGYLKKRGFDLSVIKKFKIGAGKGETIYFPIFNEDDDLINIRYRKNFKGKKQVKQTSGAEQFLFGINTFNKSKKRVCITEGEFDTMAGKQYFPKRNFCSVPNGANSGITPIGFWRNWGKGFKPGKIQTCGKTNN